MNTTLQDLDTPALLVDLAVMESNLERMASYFRHRSAKLRPHFKTHQVVSLAARQLKAGAIGITCARLIHAEALVEHGLGDILIASEIAGEENIKRLVELSSRATVIVAVDNARIIADMARLAGNRVGNLRVVVDVEVGLRRCGVLPGEAALALAKVVLEKRLQFCGLMGYAGAVRLPPGPEKEKVFHSSLSPLIATKALLERERIPVPIITCGGTSTYTIAASVPEITDIQAGSYLLMDSDYAAITPEFQPALTVLGTVISKASKERLVLDTGVKALSSERGIPLVKGRPGLSIRALHAEHALVEILDPAMSIEVGDRIELWVRYLDSTLQLHDLMYGIRDGKVEEALRLER